MLDKDKLYLMDEDNLAEFSLYCGKNGRVYNGDDVRWAYTGTIAFNRVLFPRFPEAIADKRVLDIFSMYRSLSAKPYWILDSNSTPSHFGGKLLSLGYMKAEWTGMDMDLADLPDSPAFPEGFSVVEIEDDSLVRPWTDVLLRSYSWPELLCEPFRKLFSGLGMGKDSPLRHFLGYVDGRPASACSIYRGTEAIGVYLVAVAPEFRRKGIGTATTWYALSRAKEAGGRICVLQASAMGAYVYPRFGFSAHGKMELYTPKF